MLKRLKPYLIFAMLLPALFSCEGETRLSRSIENRTEYDIALVIFNHDNSKFPIDTVKIASGETFAFDEYELLGGTSEIVHPMQGADSVKYVAPPGVFVDLEIMNANNWMREVKQISNVPSVWEHSYRFVLKPENLWVVTMVNQK